MIKPEWTRMETANRLIQQFCWISDSQAPFEPASGVIKPGSAGSIQGSAYHNPSGPDPAGTWIDAPMFTIAILLNDLKYVLIAVVMVIHRGPRITLASLLFIDSFAALYFGFGGFDFVRAVYVCPHWMNS